MRNFSRPEHFTARASTAVAGVLLMVSSAMFAIVPVANAAEAGAAANGRIAFASNRATTLDANGNSSAHIYTMNPDGSDPRQFISTGSGPAFEYLAGSAWSPDGSRLASQWRNSGADATPFHTRVHTYPAASNLSHFTFSNASVPSWSPSGTQFVVATGTVNGLWIMNTNGTGATRISTLKAFDPDWSPDGTKIAFSSDDAGSLQIFTINIDGTGLTKLTTSGSNIQPDWSPSGTRLTFTSNRVGSDQVFTMSADGSQQRILTSEGVNRSPEWSPTGEMIAFSSDRDGNREIYVMDADGFNQTNLTNNPAEDARPSWQRQEPAPVGADTVGLVDPTQGRWYLQNRFKAITTFYFGNPGDIPFLGDWNCNGIDTPGLYRPSDGFVYLRNTNTQGFADIEYFFGNPSDIPLAGDFDGDGCDTVSLYRPSESTVYIINRLGSAKSGLGAADMFYPFGEPGDVPFVGDFDGDTKDTIALYRASTGLVYEKNTHSPGFADITLPFSFNDSAVFAGDWNASGADSPGAFSRSTGLFSLRFTNTGGSADSTFSLGAPSWFAVSGANDLG